MALRKEDSSLSTLFTVGGERGGGKKERGERRPSAPLAYLLPLVFFEIKRSNPHQSIQVLFTTRTFFKAFQMLRHHCRESRKARSFFQIFSRAIPFHSPRSYSLSLSLSLRYQADLAF